MGSNKTKKRSRSTVFKKRSFHGNKHATDISLRPSETQQSEPNFEEGESSQHGDSPEGEQPAAKKQKLIDDGRIDGNEEESNNYFVFINMGILIDLVSSLGKCTECGSSIEVCNLVNSRMGFATKIRVNCASCAWEQSLFLSKECSPTIGRGRNFFEVNIRSVMAFREIGKGHSAIQNFARCMNMKCISENGYANLTRELSDAYENAAEASKAKAASEVKQSCTVQVDGKHLCQCSLDGSWQKRGHASLNGIVTAISSGKCLDTAVLSKHCKACHIWESRKGTPEYENWLASHNCKINHKKSSGAMEAAGAVEIFCRSVDKHGLIYQDYIGDGDTTSFKEVVAAKPYEKYGITPNKLECVGHIQKRLGNRLRVLRKSCKNTKTPLSGRGKLTDKVINSLQNYFGLAIRQNKGNLYSMKKAVGAILWHSTNFQDDNYRHRFCPSGTTSWCKWKKNQEEGSKKSKSTINLPIWIHDLLKPIFVDLSSDELLNKCLHGKTQNANEAFNNIIWIKCPKNIFLERNALEIGVNSAVLEFNEGPLAIHSVLKHFNIDSGVCTKIMSLQKLRARVGNIKKKDSEVVKKRRKKLRSIKKGYMDEERQKEGGESYIAGGN